MRTEESIKDTILGIIHRELTDTVRLDKQIKMRDRIFEMLSEEGNLIIPHVVDRSCSNCHGWGYTVDENGRRKGHCNECE